MCFGGGKQPAAPVNPAPYSLADSHTAVTQTAATTKEVDDEDTVDTTEAATTNPTAPTVGGGAGTAFRM